MHQRTIAYHCDRDGGPELVLCREEVRSYPWHFHVRHWTFGLVRAGSVVVSTVQGAFPLAPGQTFVIEPFAPHALSILRHSSLAVLCAEEPGSPAAGQAYRLAAPRNNEDASEGMRAWLAAPGAGPALLVRGPVLEATAPVAATRRLLAARPDEHFSLDALARFAGYSPWHFLRAFKKETGLPPHAFHLICRLSRARAMLRAGTAAAEAAVSAGFTDQSHLHKLFRRHHGLTPGQFAEAHITRGQ